ncbi:hypothetical protein AX14_000408 [Amanita brunnescens Koide BX004]|nr:hypothetical protein AX14_000408 [Amanita brunnescens Koide BX004]
MNTIIIHPFNRVKSTPMHEMSAALIAPVSKWYRKPTPWWIDDFEEVRLQPIVETDEIAEEEDDDVIDEQEEDEEVVDEDDDAEGVAFGAFVDAEPARNGMATCSFYIFCLGAFNVIQGNDEDDILEIDRDPRDDEIEFLGDVVLVDLEASFDDDGDSECEGNDTLTDITFIGEDATIVLEAEIVDEHEWDEKAMLNIVVVEVDLENDEDEAAMNGSTTASAPAAAQTE